MTGDVDTKITSECSELDLEKSMAKIADESVVCSPDSLVKCHS